MLLALLSCDGGATMPADELIVAFEPASVDTLFALGTTVRLNPVVRDGAGRPVPDAAIAFASATPTVATVAADGVVTAAGNGSTIVTATSGGASASLTVHVRQRLESVALAPASTRLGVGATRALSATGLDARSVPILGLPAPVFSSSDAGVARVSADGVITGVGIGSTTLTASIISPADGPKSGTAMVSVAAVGSTATVQLGPTDFTPALVDIVVGGSVTFVNGSGTPHDVDFGISQLNIGVHSSGQSTRTFSASGELPYHCNLHAGMSGTVHVH